MASGAAPASASTSIHAIYPVKGSTFVKAANFTLPLGPGKLTNCGLATPLINLTLPGPGNTIMLTLGKAKIG